MASQRRRGKGEGSITQLVDGRWQARVDLGYERGKRVRKAFYGKTRKEVQEKLTTALHDHQRGLPLPNERQTVGQFLDDWLENTARHTIRPTTFDGYSDLVHHHLVPILGRIPLAKLAPQQIAACYGDLLAKGLAPRTVQYAHAVLHRALEQAVRWNLVARNPTDAVDAPRPQRKEITVLTADQAQIFLNAAKEDRLHALYVLALLTGMRQGEMLGLRWHDVDFAAGSLSVRRTLVRTSQGWSWSEPKTAKGRRTIALPALAVEALRQHRIRQLEERLRSGVLWEDLDLVFPNHTGKPLERQNVVKRSFRPLLVRAGLPAIRFHDLRHSAATLLLSLGEHPKVVQERLGHSTIGVTMDTYSHVLPDMQRKAASRLDALFAAEAG
jgi:integrase